jgi:hypothetical protein
MFDRTMQKTLKRNVSKRSKTSQYAHTKKEGTERGIDRSSSSSSSLYIYIKYILLLLRAVQGIAVKEKSEKKIHRLAMFNKEDKNDNQVLAIEKIVRAVREHKRRALSMLFLRKPRCDNTRSNHRLLPLKMISFSFNSRTFLGFCSVCVVLFVFSFCPKSVEAIERYSPIEDRNVREASGLVKSRKQRKVFWTHNDSGDRARLFAIFVDEDSKSSKVIAEVTVMNAGNRDWEDLALWKANGGDKLCAGDIGSVRKEVVVYCFPEPSLSIINSSSSVEVKQFIKVPFTEKFRFEYPDDDKFDAETLMVDPNTDQFLIVTKKEQDKGGLYRSRTINELSRDKKNDLKFIRTIKLYGTNSGATGGDISWSGKKIVLKSYGRYIYEYSRDTFFREDGNPNVRGIGEWDPSEALALENDEPDENIVYTLNEGSGSSLRRYRLR